MAGFYDAIDVFFSYEGDWHIDDRGDLQDTSFDYLRAIHQHIINIVKSARGDWKYQSKTGANLSDFVGQPNTQKIGNALKERIMSSLLTYNLIKINDLGVQVVPLSSNTIAFKIYLSVSPTRNNGYANKLTINFTYDYIDSNVSPVIGDYNIK